MKKQRSRFRRIVSVVTGFAMLVCGLNTILMPKATAASSTDWGSYDRVSDASTMDGYQSYLGAGSLTTEYSGAVWTDKSVFTSAEAFSDYTQASTGIGVGMEATNDNFLIALSAMSSNKQIAGYSNLPTDTILVVDASSSMSHESKADMVKGLNEAITKLNAVNNHNRVGVVIYDGDAEIFMPLGRYTAGSDDVFITGAASGSGYGYDTTYSFTVASGVKKDGAVYSKSYTSGSGTFTQDGVYTAMEMFLQADPVIDSGEIQGGTTRIPIMVLMTDGEPSRSDKDFYAVDKSDSNSTDDRAVFLTQLTLAYSKAKIEDHYDTNALLYTLAYDLGSSQSARNLLDPKNADQTNKNHRNTYLNTAVDKEVTILNAKVKRVAEITDFDYSDQYFVASVGQLTGAFDTIVQQIILQSAYYVTMTNAGDPDMTGYLTVTDTIGNHMDICDIKGMVHDGSLYTGSLFAEAFADSRILNSENGAAIIEIMEHRLNCDDQNAVKLLLSDAIADGQIYYNSDTDFGNSIMWKADADKSYIGLFPNGGTLEDVADDADVTYVARSYGYFAGVQTGLDEVNLGYVGVDVFYEVATEQQTVVWTIPASLVPTTTYEVQLSTDDIDNPGDVSVTVNATEALRLVYEVRLDTRIDPVSIGSGAYEDHKNADGTYSFYTNEFDTQNLTMSSGNTVADFQPSTGNEFYYYTEDTALYYKDGNEYKLYTGSIPPEETDLQFFAVNYVFNWERPAGADGSYEADATMERVFEPVAEASLANVFKDEGIWYIPKGTQSMYTADYGENKQVNATETQSFVSNPFIIPGTSSDAMGVQDYLGNNGVLTLAPTQGIMVRKECDPPNSAEDVDFTFNIQLSPVEELEDSYPARKVYADGTYEDFMVEPVNGVVTMTLQGEQEFYLLELAPGVRYSVTEEQHPDYVLKSINGSGSLEGFNGVIEQYVIQQSLFINRPKTFGSLTVEKEVLHPFDADEVPDAMANATFTVQVELGDEYANKTINSSIGQLTADRNGVLTFTVKDGDSVVLEHIEELTRYTVTETAMGDGFTLDANQSSGLTGQIVADEAVAELVNVYDPDPVSGETIDLTGEKIFSGRDWKDGDSFTFHLQKFNGTSYVTVDTAVVSYDAANAAFTNFDFHDFFAEETFDAVGTYLYRVLEDDTNKLGGVSYDPAKAEIEVVVTDEDVDGVLEIADVNVIGNAVVTQDGDNWGVHVTFTNTYAASGTADIDINVVKMMDDDANAGHGVQGYVFELVDLTTNKVIATVTSDAEGKAEFDLDFTAADVGKTFTYQVREVEGTVPGMKYDATVYDIDVTVIDNLDGTISAVIYQSGETYDTGSIQVDFINEYDPEDANVTLEAEKQLSGRDLAEGEFNFLLYETRDDFVIAQGAQAIDSALNGANGIASFDQITYDTVGEHYYVIVEDDSNPLERVEYDQAKYYVTVVVSDSNGELVPDVTIVDASGAEVETAVFRNVYTPKPDDISITVDVQKIIDNLSVATILPEGFTFSLVGDNDTDLTAVTDANGKASFTLSYSEDDIGKTYEYTVSEVDDGKQHVTYDQTEYKVTVTIRLNADNTLEALVKVNNESVTKAELTFTNLYNKPSQGLMIVKQYDDPNDTTDTVFTFDIELTSTTELSASYPVRFTYADGTHADSNMSHVNGKMTVELKAGQSFQLMDLEPGVSYTVTEREHPAYVLKSINGDTNLESFSGIVVEGERAEGIFVNRKLATGSLRITKIVEHPFAEGQVPDAMAGKEFTVRVSLGADYANQVVDSTIGALTADADGNVTFVIRDGQSVVLRGIAERTAYTVTETAMGEGFTFDRNASSGLSGIIFEDDAAAILVNEYDFAPVGGDEITLTGEKIFTGRDWKDGDSFTFHLQKFNGTEYVTIASRTVTYDAANAAFAQFDFNTVFDSEQFDQVGEYFYRVIEDDSNAIGGVTYDTNRVDIKVTVTDNDVDGKLEISNVTITSGEHADVAHSGNAWNIDVEFHNTYAAEGSVRIAVNVDKTMRDTAGMGHDAEGFTFELVDENGNVVTECVTDAAGKGQMFLNFEAKDAGNTYTFILREKNDGQPGMQYDTANKSISVDVIDNLDGTVSAIVYTTGAADKGNSTQIGAAFANTYDPTDTSVTLEAEKILDGRELAEGEFTFLLYQTDADFLVADGQAAIDEASNDADGHVVFDTIKYSTVGTRYYVIVEDTSNPLERVTYDDAAYFVRVDVTDNGKGELTRTVTIQKAGEDVEEIIFRNLYTPKPEDIGITIDIEKIVENIGAGKISAEGFSFVLGNVQTGDIATVQSDAEGNAVIELSYSEDDIGKTYEYVVCEVNDGRLYVDYDETEYRIFVTIVLQEDNTLKANITVNDEVVEQVQLTFTNTYDKPAPPKTGDSFPKHWVMMGLTMLFCTAFILSLDRKRKSN